MRPEVEKSPDRGLPPAATRLWDFLFPQKSGKSASNDPIRCEVPALRAAEIAAVYYDQRRAGDFYEFMRVGRSRLLFALLDMAGRRADTREILRAAQKTFREIAAQGFGPEDFNETTAMMDLCHELNRTILQRGIRACPGFLGVAGRLAWDRRGGVCGDRIRPGGNGSYYPGHSRLWCA